MRGRLEQWQRHSQRVVFTVDLSESKHDDREGLGEVKLIRELVIDGTIVLMKS